MSRDLFSKATLPGLLMLPAGLAPPAAAENNTQTTPEGIGSLYSSKGHFHKRGGKKKLYPDGGQRSTPIRARLSDCMINQARRERP